MAERNGNNFYQQTARHGNCGENHSGCYFKDLLDDFKAQRVKVEGMIVDQVRAETQLLCFEKKCDLEKQLAQCECDKAKIEYELGQCKIGDGSTDCQSAIDEATARYIANIARLDGQNQTLQAKVITLTEQKNALEVQIKQLDSDCRNAATAATAAAAAADIALQECRYDAGLAATALQDCQEATANIIAKAEARITKAAEALQACQDAASKDAIIATEALKACQADAAITAQALQDCQEATANIIAKAEAKITKAAEALQACQDTAAKDAVIAATTISELKQVVESATTKNQDLQAQVITLTEQLSKFIQPSGA